MALQVIHQSRSSNPKLRQNSLDISNSEWKEGEGRGGHSFMNYWELSLTNLTGTI